MRKILFLHGFYASGQCVPAMALRDAFNGRAEVITPDLPMHPKEAISHIRELIDKEKPDLLVGNSCGAFYAQMAASETGIPALLGNPHFKMTEFLRDRIGNHQYKSPRRDGQQEFTIDETLIEEFAEMETTQFDTSVRPYVGPNELSFTIPMSRFKSMTETMKECFLFDSHAWKKVKARLEG